MLTSDVCNSHFPRIYTPRLILRPLIIDDADDLMKATDETWKDLNRWMTWATDKAKYTNKENCANYAQKSNLDFKHGKDFVFVGRLISTGEFVLISRVAYLNRNMGEFEFCGFWCRSSFQRMGLMSETVNALTRYVFLKKDAANVTISHARDNTPSKGVIRKLGFREKCIKKNYIKLPSKEVQDSVIYELSDIDKLPKLDVSILP